MQVWEQMLLDAVGTLVTLTVTAGAAWLAHRKGWLAKPLAKLGAWLAANTGQISDDVLAALKDLATHQHTTPTLKIGAATSAPIHQAQAIQGDAGFHGAGVEGSGAGGGGGGNAGGVQSGSGGGAGG